MLGLFYGTAVLLAISIAPPQHAANPFSATLEQSGVGDVYRPAVPASLMPRAARPPVAFRTIDRTPLRASTNLPQFDRTAIGFSIDQSALPRLALWRSGTATTMVENDSLLQRSDRDYTSGLRLEWMSDPVQDRAQFGARGLERRYGFALSQEIFTPEKKRRTTLGATDRPYGGYLYVSRIRQAVTDNSERTAILNVGVVGPYSMAQQTQDMWHRATHFKTAAGWATQLKNEPGVEYSLTQRQRIDGPRILGAKTQALTTLGATVGNVRTQAVAGVEVRFGTELDRDFGPASLGSGRAQSFQSRRSVGGYAYARFGARAVARDMFLDGNLIAKSHSVEKKTLVNEWETGYSVLLPKARVTASMVHTDRTYVGQSKPTAYASLSVSFIR